jgi:hypothetical protein
LVLFVGDVATVSGHFALGFVVIHDRGRCENLVGDGGESFPHLAQGVEKPKSIAEHRDV